MNNKERRFKPDLLFYHESSNVFLPVEFEVRCTVQTVVQSSLYKALAQYNAWMHGYHSLKMLKRITCFVLALDCPRAIRSSLQQHRIPLFLLLDNTSPHYLSFPPGCFLQQVQQLWLEFSYQTLTTLLEVATLSHLEKVFIIALLLEFGSPSMTAITKKVIKDRNIERSDLNVHATRELPPEYMSYFTSEQLQGLTPEQLQGLTPAQLKGLTPEQLQGLTPAQLQGLTPAQLKGLTPEQLQGLTPAQLQGLTPEQLQDLTPAQLSRIAEETLLKALELKRKHTQPRTD
jgi:hypothetical protein